MLSKPAEGQNESPQRAIGNLTTGDLNGQPAGLPIVIVLFARADSIYKSLPAFVEVARRVLLGKEAKSFPKADPERSGGAAAESQGSPEVSG